MDRVLISQQTDFKKKALQDSDRIWDLQSHIKEQKTLSETQILVLACVAHLAMTENDRWKAWAATSIKIKTSVV